METEDMHVLIVGAGMKIHVSHSQFSSLLTVRSMF
jgi:hypothetical protein